MLVLLAYAAAVEDGLDPARRVALTTEDLRPGSGVLRHCRPGLEPALDDLARLMVVVSDNTATDLLLRALGGRAGVNAALAAYGLTGAEVAAESAWVLPPAQFGLASPRGLAEVFAALAEPASVGYPPAAADRGLDVLAGQQHLNGFARHLPWSPYAGDVGIRSPVRIWSKAGSYPSVQCEAGLVESDAGRFVLAVMCDGITDWRAGPAGAGSTLLADSARLVHDAWGP